MNIQQWAFVVGLVFGSLAVLSVIYVWIKKQVFGFGGGAISLTGVILMGLSIWSSVQIQITREGIKAGFERLAEKVGEISKANAVVSQELVKLADRAEIRDRQLDQFANQVAQGGMLANSQQLLELQGEITASATVDRSRIEDALDVFSRSSKPEVF